jgi:hypothetical protein
MFRLGNFEDRVCQMSGRGSWRPGFQQFPPGPLSHKLSIIGAKNAAAVAVDRFQDFLAGELITIFKSFGQ